MKQNDKVKQNQRGTKLTKIKQQNKTEPESQTKPLKSWQNKQIERLNNKIWKLTKQTNWKTKQNIVGKQNKTVWQNKQIEKLNNKIWKLTKQTNWKN